MSEERRDTLLRMIMCAMYSSPVAAARFSLWMLGEKVIEFYRTMDYEDTLQKINEYDKIQK